MIYLGDQSKKIMCMIDDALYRYMFLCMFCAAEHIFGAQPLNIFSIYKWDTVKIVNSCIMPIFAFTHCTAFVVCIDL